MVNKGRSSFQRPLLPPRGQGLRVGGLVTVVVGGVVDLDREGAQIRLESGAGLLPVPLMDFRSRPEFALLQKILVVGGLTAGRARTRVLTGCANLPFPLL